MGSEAVPGECSEGVFYSFESNGGLLLEAIFLLYLFYTMKILTDEYFMEYIGISIKKFSLSSEGAACMIAFGSIVPEFTINCISSLFTSEVHNVLGLSTIVGSGCFDFTLCLAIAAIVTHFIHGELEYSFLSILKDYLTYLAVLILILWTVIDTSITLLDTIIILLVTPYYIISVFLTNDNQQVAGFMRDIGTQPPQLPRLHQVVRAPILKVFDCLVPTYSGLTRQIVIAFAVLVSLAFGITRLTVYLLQRILCHASIPESLVGLTIISWGNNIGDIMNSAVAAKRGNAQLAITSVLATQLLNLIFSLGFPWLLSNLLFGPMSINDLTTLYSLYFALTIVVLSMSGFALSKPRFRLRLGVYLLLLYVVYVSGEWIYFQES